MKACHKNRARHDRRVANRAAYKAWRRENKTDLDLLKSLGLPIPRYVKRDLQPIPFSVGQTVKIVSGAGARYIGTKATVLGVTGDKVSLAAYRRKAPLELAIGDVEAA